MIELFITLLTEILSHLSTYSFSLGGFQINVSFSSIFVHEKMNAVHIFLLLLPFINLFELFIPILPDCCVYK